MSGQQKCLLCGNVKETERSGKLYVGEDKKSAAHVACMKLYAIMTILWEMDQPEPFPIKIIKQ